jgi:alpha 1,3-glucosidase
MSESGIVDLFLLPGPNPAALYKQYSSLTGTQALPPMFALGYHQCRWNYKDERDVAEVHNAFEAHDFPFDVLWLDIEHTDGKRYFTWDKHLFPSPTVMQQALSETGRKMVTIVDPHIKRDNGYRIHNEATSLNLYVKDGDKDYVGYCWPGDSGYLDFTAPRVRQWWAEQFALDKYEGSTPDLYVWNDMNEPSVFNGPEVSMQKTITNLDGIESREWHNLYGMLFQRATSEGLILRSEGKQRPFVLSRAFYAGSQRYGAIWTGDNAAEWSHLVAATPMLLTINLAGLSFAGADVGGFFGDTEPELMVRWMQAGAYHPFFRGHAHHDSPRREPWVFGDEVLSHLRHAAMSRYALLPYWYTVFQEASASGMPVMRTLWMEGFCGGAASFDACLDIDDEYTIGRDLLVKPVTKKGATDAAVFFPANEVWYDVETLASIAGTGKHQTVAAPIGKIPVYQRGGSIIAKKLRLRRSSKLMKNDPYTLYVAMSNSDAAKGKLYIDDESSFDYQEGKGGGGAFIMREFSMQKNDLKNTATKSSSLVAVGGSDDNAYIADNEVERIVFIGLSAKPKSIIKIINGGSDEQQQQLSFLFDESTMSAIVRKPNLKVSENWTVRII